MKKLSKKTRDVLESLPRMKVCQLARYVPHSCSRKIDWHHNLIFKGSQSDIPETILGLCTEIHRIVDRKDVKEYADWIMLNQMSDEQIKSVSKAINYEYKKQQLNKKYGSYHF